MNPLKRYLACVFLCGLFFVPLTVSAAQQPRAAVTGSASSSAYDNTGASAVPSGSLGSSVGSASSVAGTAARSGTVSSGDYVLGTGDKIKLTVYGENDLSGEYEVSSTGVISLPLIGTIPATHRTINDFEQAVTSKLSEGYLRDPRVSAQVINYRPFFILGEVSKPGSYPYVNGMTIINAVALAGGYTYRADKSEVTMTRANDPSKTDVQVSEEERVMPGDVIRVPERFF